MSVLSTEQLAEMRRKAARSFGLVDYDKPTINAAFQAIEDWYEANKAQINSEIDTATAPYQFTAMQKKALGAFWLLQKARREGA